MNSKKNNIMMKLNRGAQCLRLAHNKTAQDHQTKSLVVDNKQPSESNKGTDAKSKIIDPSDNDSKENSRAILKVKRWLNFDKCTQKEIIPQKTLKVIQLTEQDANQCKLNFDSSDDDSIRDPDWVQTSESEIDSFSSCRYPDMSGFLKVSAATTCASSKI